MRIFSGWIGIGLHRASQLSVLSAGFREFKQLSLRAICLSSWPIPFLLVEMVSYTALLSLLPLLAVANGAAVNTRQSISYPVTGGTKVAVKDAAPVGIS
jgi:hypothetical protein